MERLRAAGIEPSPEADRRILIRRVYFDLHGLPPSPSEIDAFVNDPAPDAYEKLVDRLLASPRYGERWGRHWLDVVHYGESHGYDKDKPRRNAWPYRDYVIRAFNEDKPYARFVQEQLAGDVLFPDDPEALSRPASSPPDRGILSAMQELREGTTDKDITRAAGSRRHGDDHHVHVRQHDGALRPLPRSQVRPDSAGGLLQPAGGVCRSRPRRPAVRSTIRRFTRAARNCCGESRAIQMRLQPLLDKAEFATSPEIVELDNSIQDAVC